MLCTSSGETIAKLSRDLPGLGALGPAAAAVKFVHKVADHVCGRPQSFLEEASLQAETKQVNGLRVGKLVDAVAMFLRSVTLSLCLCFPLLRSPAALPPFPPFMNVVTSGLPWHSRSFSFALHSVFLLFSVPVSSRTASTQARKEPMRTLSRQLRRTLSPQESPQRSPLRWLGRSWRARHQLLAHWRKQRQS